ncbi:MAG: protein translocase subunit SecF [Acidobacteriota bacterium]
MIMISFTVPKIDWIEKKKFFFGFSLLLILAGGISLLSKGGPEYGIDFRGGTLLQIKFAQDVNTDELRSLLSEEGLEGSTLQQYGPSSDREVLVGLDVETTTSDEGLDAGKQAIVRAFSKRFGAEQGDKVDFNNAGADTVAQYLTTRDPLGTLSGGGEGAIQSYRDLATAMVDFKNDPSQGGLLGSFEDLAKVDGVTPEVREALETDFYLSGFAIRSTEIVGPKIGADLRRQALWVVGAGLAVMLVYIWFRFELIYGLAAVIAVFHDLLITVGMLSMLRTEITLPVVAALLTLVGYSMNDTIVVFDRIRENLKIVKREALGVLINRSINQTLRRTMLTSGFTLLAVLSLFVLGGEVIHGFAMTVLIGVIVGTYSSVAVASPILLLAPGKVTARRENSDRPRVY